MKKDNFTPFKVNVQRQHPHFVHLRDKWAEKHEQSKKNLWQKHGEAFNWLKERAKHVAVGGTLSSLLLLTPTPATPSASFIPTPSPLEIPKDTGRELPFDKSAFLITDLANELPKNMRPLTQVEEDVVGQTLTRHFGFKVTSELDGKKLNRSYGLIGAEQHLARYPGDNIAIHFDSDEDARKYTSSGMAPGLGAWGYFARSRDAMTEEDSLKEKYYIAVQTFLVPDYNQRVREYSQFFKHRKMLVVNPENAHAMVVVIGDAGPGQSTGKHLGGSPEVMKYLERVDGRAKGRVLYFFIDDPHDTIPLGPVKVQQ